MNLLNLPSQEREVLIAHYHEVRACSEQLCAPLAVDDYQIQSCPATSPPKWHLAHASWFFETFALKPHMPDYKPFHAEYDFLFSDDHCTDQQAAYPRAQRGLLSRPRVSELYEYRAYVDERMLYLMRHADESTWATLCQWVVLGLNHEQQHQEQLLTDLKYHFFINPLRPAYRKDLPEAPNVQSQSSLNWYIGHVGVHYIGQHEDDFAYSNEKPRHQVLLNPHRLAKRLVTNEEYLAFVEDGGYDDPRLWLTDGWKLRQHAQWQTPLYWEQRDDVWFEMSLAGMRALNLAQPVSHISYYEADAYARWAGKRLPEEAELEHALSQHAVQGNFLEQDKLQAMPAKLNAQGEAEQWYGDVWNWTGTPYRPYPGFNAVEKPKHRTSVLFSEHEGQHMSNRMSLRGGACVSPQQHIRASYRHFLPLEARWAFSGIRLAEDL